MRFPGKFFGTILLLQLVQKPNQMAKNDNSPQSNVNDVRAQFEDERTQARIQEHLNNENDIITEQDIANIKIGAGASASDVENIVNRENQLMEDLEIDKSNDANGDADDPTIETPWNILEP